MTLARGNWLRLNGETRRISVAYLIDDGRAIDRRDGNPQKIDASCEERRLDRDCGCR